jgi:hypothetical protein
MTSKDLKVDKKDKLIERGLDKVATENSKNFGKIR